MSDSAATDTTESLVTTSVDGFELVSDQARKTRTISTSPQTEAAASSIPSGHITSDLTKLQATMSAVPDNTQPGPSGVQPTMGSDMLKEAKNSKGHKTEGSANTSSSFAPSSSGSADGGGSGLSTFFTLWQNPIKEVAPKGMHNWSGHGAYITYANTRRQASPQFMADPLYVMGYSYTNTGTNPVVNDRIEVAGHVVSVTETPRQGISAPELSIRGDVLYNNATSTPLDASLQMRNLIPTGGAVDLQAMMVLIAKYRDSIRIMARDEAPLLRAYLMLLEFMPVTAMAKTSNSLLSFRLGSTLGKVESSRHKADRRGELDGTIQIPFGCKTCDVRIIPLDVYMKKITGQVSNNEVYKDVDVNGANIVAVQGHDLTQGWFMPFLIAHTTTLWWNCTMTHTVDLKHAARSSSGSYLKARTLKRSSCVYVPGNYSHILIVVTDWAHRTCEIDIPHIGKVKMGPKIADFDKRVFAYCGMDDPYTEPDINEIVVCLNKMCRKIALPGDEGTVMSMVRELAFNVKLGGSVNVNGKKGANGFGRYDIVAKNYTIDGTELYDLGVSYADIKPWMEGFADWSVSPCGKFANSLFQLNNTWTSGTPAEKNVKENDSRFALYNVTTSAPAYAVSETFGPLRVLRECGMFEGRVECEQKWDTYTNVYNSLQGGASLLAGVAGWVMCEVGFNVMDLNGLYIGTSRGCVPNHGQDVMSALTVGFMSPTEYQPHRYSAKEAFGKAVETNLGITTTSNVKSFDITLWPSIHVPFWFVHACVGKFGEWRDFKPEPRQPLPLFDLTSGAAAGDLEDMDCDLVFTVDMMTKDWRTLPALCSQRSISQADAGYAVAHPRFYLPRKFNSPPALGVVGFMPLLSLDMTKANVTAAAPWGYTQPEPQAVPFVRLRQQQNTRLPVYAIIRDLPACPYGPHFPVNVSMEYPDPPPEWMRKVWAFLKDEGKVAMPSLMKGDIVGAMGAVGIDVLVKAIQELSTKMGDDRKFSAGLVDDRKFEHAVVND
uniref:Putative capsid protein n=1 Tax=Drama totivirus TaxID=2805774 RepID=A0A889INW5_9VIRU|nr:MAG: putative capsid protein [Drama totivirus]